MEELFSDNKLGELEEKIDVLLETYRSVTAQKGDLTGKLEALENENLKLKEALAKAESEKNIIMNKVKGILEKIQKIEV
jgi:hypothetical protein